MTHFLKFRKRPTILLVTHKMPSWWGKSSSKDAKKKTTRENFIDTLHRFISSSDQKGTIKSGVGRKRCSDIASEKGSRSRADSRSSSPSTQVSRCQSFADRPIAQPLPLPGLKQAISRTSSGINVSKPILEKRGKPQLVLPMPTPGRVPKRPEMADTDGDLVTASVSSYCSVDSDEATDSRLHSPVGNDFDRGISGVQREQSSLTVRKSSMDTSKPAISLLNSQFLSSSPKRGPLGSQSSVVHGARNGAFGSAPDSSMSSPSRSPIRGVFPEQIPTSAFWAAKPHPDVTFLGSGQCSSPGSGQTSGHNSMGGEMLGQFWQHSRGSPEYSPIPSPRMTSPGPSSRIHSGAVSPLHPRAGGTAPESPTSRPEEAKKQSHRLPLPPINISNSSPFSPTNMQMQSCTSSIPKSPGRTDNPPSPGSRWKKGKLIGRGTFGHVYVGFNSESGEMCAMKEVTLFMDDAKSKESAKQLGQEISLLRQLRHQNVVQYYGCEMLEDKLYIYLEYVSGGSIHKLLQEYGQFGEPAIRSYTQQILSGLAYLHTKKTVHRDIKGANILVDPNGRVKLADFGMAKHITGQSCPLSFRGSPYWMAPEVIKNMNGCNLAVDIWSLGCTVLEMATSKPPWSQYEGIAAMFKIGNSKELPTIPDHLSEEGKDFIRQCLQRDPSKRPSAAELLQHPFIKNASQLEKSTLGFSPPEQPSVIANVSNSKCVGQVRNLCSLDMDGQAMHQLRSSKISAIASDVHMRNMSCPVSPIGSPLLFSSSPQHINGRMSPSPISSPRTMSGASTPLTGGNGALPFNHTKPPVYLYESLPTSRLTMNDPHSHHSSRSDLFNGMLQSSVAMRERITADTEILGSQRYDLYETHEKRSSLFVDNISNHILRDHVKLSPSLDLHPRSPNDRRVHGI
ncbi:mitogen-activated protein kinase kinase kinase YODA isoform X2 [Phalaenopsis equestris]|uniref:mitogen-activated protein kinase kinase kinase YODA isoform X2 n=1 Tax=Phalaenopsis equestris TaxID=78828 RepID=UPI0009E237EF|nr:mitogen-activated protein kinase kinase kinase YODA isoform X2 [Phalaenopsis equestris]XP_020587614.1 mitogen-activated protein kinase kinase kinase YODA isoform X2 [Phalaenopsis equestris]